MQTGNGNGDAEAGISSSGLRAAAGALLGAPVRRVRVQSEPLHGGTLGDVLLITGNAQTEDGRTLPFRLVQKTQKRWVRPGDPESWRREYDLAQTDFAALFTDAFHQPRCFHAEIGETENRIWMETAEGRSGLALTLDDLELAAGELGRFQGRCLERAESLRRIACFGDEGTLRREFAQWSPDTLEYRTLRCADCPLPERLRQLILGAQERSDAIYDALGGLPRVLCHRDFWAENIFVHNGAVTVIDWDCAGWGCIGEDIASLIADETEASQIGAYCRRLLPAYYRALGESMALPPMETIPIREMIVLKFGYRFLQQAMFARSPEPKAQAILALEEIAAL